LKVLATEITVISDSILDLKMSIVSVLFHFIAISIMFLLGTILAVRGRKMWVRGRSETKTNRRLGMYRSLVGIAMMSFSLLGYLGGFIFALGFLSRWLSK
jgi:hypothetical protein